MDDLYANYLLLSLTLAKKINHLTITITCDATDKSFSSPEAVLGLTIRPGILHQLKEHVSLKQSIGRFDKFTTVSGSDHPEARRESVEIVKKFWMGAKDDDWGPFSDSRVFRLPSRESQPPAAACAESTPHLPCPNKRPSLRPRRGLDATFFCGLTSEKGMGGIRKLTLDETEPTRRKIKALVESCL